MSRRTLRILTTFVITSLAFSLLIITSSAGSASTQLVVKVAQTTTTLATTSTTAIAPTTTTSLARTHTQKPAKPNVNRPPVQVSSDAKGFIYGHEGGPCSYNPGKVSPDCNYQGDRACGIGQANPCSKLRNVCGFQTVKDANGVDIKVPKPNWMSDYACQDNWFTNNYMIPRYGTWENAKAFWLAHSWW